MNARKVKTPKISNVVFSIENMTSYKSNNTVKNQFVIRDGKFSIFKSYNSIIAVIDNSNGEIFIDKNKYDFSNTTKVYLKNFLELNSFKEVENNIKKNIYHLVDLNQ